MPRKRALPAFERVEPERELGAWMGFVVGIESCRVAPRRFVSLRYKRVRQVPEDPW